MAFFDKKEEVIDIELTPYGKFLLSRGRFAPIYYEFYDDDILYDAEYGQQTEMQGQIEERIKKTPRLKTQYTFESAEERYKKYREQVKKQKTLNVPILEKRNNFSFGTLPIANASIDTEQASSINIHLLKGNIESVNSLDSRGMPKNVKECNLKKMETLISVRKKRANESESEDLSNSKQVFQIGEDEIEIIKKDGYLLFDITELNVPIRNDNYEMYIYEIETSGSKVISETPLTFRKEQNNVKNNILYDYEEMPEVEYKDTDNFVEYYFSVLVDKEIPQEILIEHLPEKEIDNLVAKEGYEFDYQQLKLEKRMMNPELDITEEEISELEDC